MLLKFSLPLNNQLGNQMALCRAVVSVNETTVVCGVLRHKSLKISLKSHVIFYFKTQETSKSCEIF